MHMKLFLDRDFDFVNEGVKGLFLWQKTYLRYFWNRGLHYDRLRFSGSKELIIIGYQKSLV